MADSSNSLVPMDMPFKEKINLVDFNFQEMVVPGIRQRKANVISPTGMTAKSLWNAWKPRSVNSKDVIENHPANFNAIKRMLAVDGYVKTAVSKYINSIFLRGYVNFTLNKDIEKFLKIRLQMIIDAMPDHNHLDDFYQAIAKDLVVYANVYLVKVRAPHGKLPKGMKEFTGLPLLKFPNNINKNQTVKQDPIAAYELIHPASMHIIRDDKGSVTAFEQWPIDARERPADKKYIREWDPEQVIHIVIDREDGHAYGIPSLNAIIEDLRLFRELEDCASRLAYRYAFPFTQVIVGKPIPTFQASEEDIKYYGDLVKNAPPDATIVTNEKVSVEIAGVQGEALDLKPYIEHFRSRLFSGLQVSDIAMGIGDSTNRATADALTVEMHDQIKHYQNIIARNISIEIYRELLLEAGWNLYDNPEKNFCDLKFKEIEIEAQITRETHILSLVQGNLISIDEGRARMELQPFTDAQWKDSYLMKVMLPQDAIKVTGMIDLDKHGNMMQEKHDADMDQAGEDLKASKLSQLQQKKELSAPLEQNDAQHRTTTNIHAITTGGGKRTVKKSTQIKEPTGPAANAKSTAKAASFKIRPANQHGRRIGPKRATESDNYISPVEVDLTVNVEDLHETLADIYMDFSREVLSSMEDHFENPQTSRDIPTIIDFVYKMVAIRFNSICETFLHPAFHLGWEAFELAENVVVPQYTLADTEVLDSFNKDTITRFISDISAQLSRTVKEDMSNIETLSAIRNVFDTHAYRLEFLANTELAQAFFYGLSCATFQVYEEMSVIPSIDESQCDVCINKAGTIIRRSMSGRVRLSNLPPWHANCNCMPVPVISDDPIGKN